MIFGFSGVQASSRSAVAAAVAERLGYSLHSLRPGTLLANRGFDTDERMSRLRRIAAQEILLETHEEALRGLSRPTVVDGTPLDMLAYMLAEVGMHDEPALASRITDYADRCLALARRYFDGLLIVRPDDAPPGSNAAHALHVQTLIEGAAGRLRGTLLTSLVKPSGFEERVEAAVRLLDQEEQDMRAERERTHLPLH